MLARTIFCWEPQMFNVFRRNDADESQEIVLGRTGKRNVTWKREQQPRHLGLFGGPGTGKTLLMRNMAAQHITQGGGLLCVDGNMDNNWMMSFS
jgi:F0F1-type ATP synthase beta subunit